MQNNKNCIKMHFDENIIIGDENIDINEYIDIWNKEQNEMVNKIKYDNMNLDDIKYIGGMDLSFKKGTNNGIGCLIIHEYKTMNLVAEFSIKCQVNIPYKAGYLAFREAPILLKLIECVREEYPELMPQLILIDGNGVWHPRGCGIATHFSILSGIPSVGVSKNVLCIDDIDRKAVEKLLLENAKNKDEIVRIKDLGYAYNVTGNIKKAIYVSVGNNITLEQSINIVKSVAIYRISEPIRKADKLSRLLIL